jgi:hypothetical protein
VIVRTYQALLTISTCGKYKANDVPIAPFSAMMMVLSKDTYSVSCTIRWLIYSLCSIWCSVPPMPPSKLLMAIYERNELIYTHTKLGIRFDLSKGEQRYVRLAARLICIYFAFLQELDSILSRYHFLKSRRILNRFGHHSWHQNVKHLSNEADKLAKCPRPSFLKTRPRFRSITCAYTENSLKKA